MAVQLKLVLGFQEKAATGTTIANDVQALPSSMTMTELLFCFRLSNQATRVKRL